MSHISPSPFQSDESHLTYFAVSSYQEVHAARNKNVVGHFLQVSSFVVDTRHAVVTLSGIDCETTDLKRKINGTFFPGSIVISSAISIAYLLSSLMLISPCSLLAASSKLVILGYLVLISLLSAVISLPSHFSPLMQGPSSAHKLLHTPYTPAPGEVKVSSRLGRVS